MFADFSFSPTQVLCANLSSARAESRAGNDEVEDDDEAEYALAEAAADAEAFAASTGWARRAGGGASSERGPFSAAAATGLPNGQPFFQRTARSIAVLTGADDDVYYEFGDGSEYEE
jgi:hypothetical protein